MYEELKSSGITENTPKEILLGAGTIHKGLKMVDIYTVLDAEPADWDTNYASYFTKSGEDYTAVTGDSAAPEFAAGTYYAKSRGWNFEESLVGATSGGSTVTITPEYYTVPIDGALVKVKGLDVKVGETATFQTNLVELTPEALKMLVVGDEIDSGIEGYKEIVSRAQVKESDYIQNLGFIGRKTNGTPVVIIFDYALCTSGLSLNGQNKQAGVVPATFECYAELSPECDRLPYHIYYPAEEQA